MNYTFSTDDNEEANRLMHSGEAWECLERLRQAIRSHKKHGAAIDLDAAYQDICETLEWIEQ